MEEGIQISVMAAFQRAAFGHLAANRQVPLFSIDVSGGHKLRNTLRPDDQTIDWNTRPAMRTFSAGTQHLKTESRFSSTHWFFRCCRNCLRLDLAPSRETPRLGNDPRADRVADDSADGAGRKRVVAHQVPRPLPDLHRRGRQMKAVMPAPNPKHDPAREREGIGWMQKCV
jgi:hypothetical protein